LEHDKWLEFKKHISTRKSEGVSKAGEDQKEIKKEKPECTVFSLFYLSNNFKFYF
jgi:hypothetical protein